MQLICFELLPVLYRLKEVVCNSFLGSFQMLNDLPWDTLWQRVKLARMTPDGGPYGLIEDGALAVKSGMIAWAGPTAELPGPTETLAAEIHDGMGMCVTPGLIDCHTHLVYAGNRAREFEMRLQGATYEELSTAGGGILSTVQATRSASQETLMRESLPRLEAMLAEGVTTVEIKSGYGLETAAEMKMLRVARKLGSDNPVSVITTFLGAHALPPEFQGNSDAYIRKVCDEMIPEVSRLQLADAVDAFCENIGFTLEQTERIFRTAREHGLPVKLHAEQLSDQKGAKLAASFNALSADHLEYVGEDGVRAMAESGTVATLLPGAFYFLRETRKPPLELFRKYSVPIALASDCNPGSSPVTSPLLMLNMACTLFRMAPEEALTGMTRNAAKALGLMDRGTLEPGKRADFALWDIEHPAELSYRIGYNPCRMVVREGNVVHPC